MRYTEAVALLRRIPVFASLDPAGLKMLAFSSTYLTLHAGEVLCQQGEAGDSVFVIDDGEVEVSVQTNGRTILLAVLGRNDLFGEMAVICNLPRTADVRARSKLTVLKIEGDVFLQLVTGNPDAALGVMRVLTERLMRFNEAYQQLKRAVPEAVCPRAPIRPA
jgi:CRP/FNR family cyclic AMP-dependent transcriptional regulator